MNVASSTADDRPRLLLAEHGRQVGDMLDRGLAGDQTRWVALGPSAMAALDRRKIAYTIPEDHFAWSELEQMCRRQHEQVEGLCDRLDELWHAEQPLLVEQELRPFGFSLFPLMIVADSIASRIFSLKRILTAHPGHVPVIHTGPALAPTDYHILFSQCEALWGRVAVEVAAELVTLEDPITPTRFAKPGAELRARMRDVLGRSVLATTLAETLSRRDFAGAARVLRMRGESVLIIGGRHDWMYLAPWLRASGLRVLVAVDSHFEAQIPPNMEDPPLKPELDAELRTRMIAEGVSVYPLLADRVRWIWNHGSTITRQASRRLSAARRHHRVQAVLRTSAATAADHSVNCATRVGGVPVCVWQHGMIMGGPEISQFRQFSDMMTADVVLAYGSVPAEAYARDGARWPDTRSVPVGSASLDALRSTPARGSGDAAHILYAPTNYYGNHWYLGGAPGLSDRWLFRDQVMIVETLRRLADDGVCRVTIKPHPSGDPAWIGELPPAQRITIASSRARFTDLVGSADVVVLDYPSTTLLQSLAARRRTFVLLRHWDPGAGRPALERAAVARMSSEELCAALSAHMHGGPFAANPEDTTFLEAYGIYRPDGAAVRRAADAVEGLLDRRERSAPPLSRGEEGFR